MTLRLNGTTGYTEIDAPAVAGNNTLVLPTGNGSSGQYLQTNGSGVLSWASAGAFASGTAMLFVQTSAPTGWTKSTSHDDKTLRVVSGAASSGGSTAFTSVFASRTPAGTVGSTTLTESQIPSHAHQYSNVFSLANSYSTFTIVTSSVVSTSSSTSLTRPVGVNNTGGGGSHNHGFTGTAMDFAVQYVDVIIATKD